MPGVPQPPEDSGQNPDGTYRNYYLPDDPDQSRELIGPTSAYRNVNVFKCTPQQAMRNIVNAIEELYKNFEYNYFAPSFLKVRNDDGTVIVENVNELVAGCMNVEDLGGNLARITPKTSQLFKAPPAGIAAASTSTLPSATCTKLEVQSGVLVTTSQTATVYNAGPNAITGDYYFMAHPIVPGCVYVAMACCEHTLTLGSGGTGGGTDPPDPPIGGDDDCVNLIPATNIYNQYDISIYGFYDNSGNPIIQACNNCPLEDSEPYVIRVTNIGNNTLSEVGFDGAPCDLDASCPWRGIDNNPATPSTSPWIPQPFPGCEVVRCFMGLAKYTPSDNPADGLSFCFATGNFSDEDMADPTGLYLWVYLDVGFNSQFMGYFVKKVDQDYTSSFDMNLTNYEVDLTWNRGGRTACLPITSELVPVADQGRCYVKISKVSSGGLLSV